jgi:hypothetical protein
VWAATVATFNANPVFLAAFFAPGSVVMVKYLHFCLRVAPAALQRWADATGYQIVEQKRAGVFDRFSVASGSGHYVYRVIVRDREGQEHQGLIRVGTPYWFCTSSNRGPVEVQWRAGVEPDTVINWAADWLRARVEGSALAGLVTTRRLVLGFAVTDLVLACLVLAFEVMMLLGVAIGIDRLSGNSPSPETRKGDLFGTAIFLGMFALYLPALVTLSAGGVGLMRRTRWGYYCHLAGVICVAVSIFAIVYTIPAVLVAIQPEFRNYCLGKQGAKTPADLIDDV